MCLSSCIRRTSVSWDVNRKPADFLVKHGETGGLNPRRNAGVGLGNFLAGIILNMFAMQGYTGRRALSGPAVWGFPNHRVLH